jgi:hypothetical protein
MSFVYTLKPHPTAKGKLIMSYDTANCQNIAEAIGGVQRRIDGEMVYVLSPAQARDMAVLIDNGFLGYANAYTDEFYFYRPTTHPYEQPTRKEALALCELPLPRCKRTLNMDFGA